MKTLSALLASALLAIALIFTPGCGTVNPNPPTKQAVVFLSINDTWIAAHTAYQGYCELAVQGKVSAKDQSDVDKAWNDFRKGLQLAIRAAQHDWNNPAPDNLKKLKDDLTTLILSL